MSTPAEPELTMSAIARQLAEVNHQLAAIHDTLHRFELRLERLDTKVDQVDKRLSDGQADARARFEGLETRLNSKAGNWVVSLWGATLAVLIALVRLWH